MQRVLEPMTDASTDASTDATGGAVTEVAGGAGSASTAAEPAAGAPMRGAVEPERELRGLFVAQFLGAFNDNAFKLFLALLAMRGLGAAVAEGTAEYEARAQSATTLAFVVFTLPLMLFSVPAAFVADRYSKRSLLVATKAAEVGLMLLGCAALWLEPAGGVLSLGVLACMGVQSAFFSPAKYGILPEVLPRECLPSGNGKLEMWTFTAIVAGTLAGGLLLDSVGAATWAAGLVLSVLAVVGLLAIRSVPPVPAACASGTVGEVFGGAWRATRRDRVLWLSVLGSMFFWGLASLVSQNALVYAKTALDLSATQAGIPLGVSVIGIGAGAFLVGRCSGHRIEPGWIPIGTIGLALAGLGLGALAPGFYGTLLWMIVLGVSSGFVIVPLNTLIQAHSPAERRGAVIALANMLAFGGILAGTLSCYAMAGAGLSTRGIFLGAAAVMLCGTAWAVWLLPEQGLRLFLVLLTQILYRLRVRGARNLPLEGGALLVCNHVSFVDGMLLQASTDRPIRFLVEDTWFNKPLFKPVMRLCGFIPITQTGGPRDMLRSLQHAGEYLDRGELVCIFAEGEITRSGQLLPFRRGFQRILKGRTVPLIPVYLDRVWGSVFSFFRGKVLRRLPKRIPYPVTVSFGAPMAPETSPHDLRSAVGELAAAAWQERAQDARPLHHAFVRSARLCPWRLCCSGVEQGQVARLGLLVQSVAIARALRAAWQGQERVGVLLPPSVVGAAVNVAASLAGRCVVNLNYTAGRAALESAVRQAGLRTVVISEAFVQKVKIELPAGVELIRVEELRRHIGFGARIVALFASLCLPLRFVERLCGASRPVRPADPATVIFSSGSTGEPKGVVLSHFNIAANGDAAAQALPVTSKERLLGILPLFHSFGEMSLWFVLRHGMAVVFHANPLDGAAIGELVQRHEISVMLATPTFLQIYLRRCAPGQFGSLRMVIVGAEKLPQRIADAFEERFGVRPLEGYGTTECAPVVAVSSPGFRAPGFYQSGARKGSVGQPLPGVAVKILDLDDGRPVPPGQPGMLLVKGPNVMQGYLGRDDLTEEVLRDGWYVTGDVACVDEDGYLRITDRLSRFSKIGGEMVPHCVVEAALHEVAGLSEQSFAVTGLPCPKKGEKLVVLHTVDPERIPALCEALAKKGLPNLFLPRQENFVPVDALPMLGTGKLDLRAVRATAEERLRAAGVGS